MRWFLDFAAPRLRKSLMIREGGVLARPGEA
jgi:hypothetical protein